MVGHGVAEADELLHAISVNRPSEEVSAELGSPEVPLCGLNALTVRIHPEFVLSSGVSVVSGLEVISLRVALALVFIVAEAVMSGAELLSSINSVPRSGSVAIETVL